MSHPNSSLATMHQCPERVPDGLTPAERRVAELLLAGFSQKETAAAMNRSPSTIAFHLRRLRARLGARTLAQLAALLTRRGLDGGRASESGFKLAASTPPVPQPRP
jgi:DNA-binding CsgD family transcriptional regulator